MCDATKNTEEIERCDFEVVSPLMNSDILLQVDLVKPPKRTQEIAQTGPKTFDCVVMDLTHAIAILVLGPDSLSRCVADGYVRTSCGSKLAVGPHSSVFTTVPG